MIYAILDNKNGTFGTVKNVAVGTFPLHDGWIDITNVNPRPETFWTYDGETFSEGSAPLVNYGTKLTRIKFKQRMTAAERIAVRSYAASTEAQAPIIFDFMDLLSEATYIDLSLPETIQGVTFLENIGLIAPGRADEILNTLITKEESF